MTDHKNHNVNLLDEAADNEKVNIVADAVMSRRRENDFKETIRQFHHTVSELRNNAQLAKREVSQAAEQKIAEIRERERQATESIETTCVTRLQKINSAWEAKQNTIRPRSSNFTPLLLWALNWATLSPKT